MKSPRIVLIACVLLLAAFHSIALTAVRAQEGAAARQIEDTLRQFYSSLSDRDVEGLRTVLDTHFVALEAANRNARLEVVNTDDATKLLPPKGNDDFKNASLSSVKVEVSATHPSVATASYTLSLPLGARQIAQFKSLLKNPPAEMTQLQKQLFAKMIEDRAVHNSMLANARAT